MDTDTVVLEVPDGIAIEDGDVADNGSLLEEERWRKWQDAYGDEFEGVELGFLSRQIVQELHVEFQIRQGSPDLFVPLGVGRDLRSNLSCVL